MQICFLNTVRTIVQLLFRKVLNRRLDQCIISQNELVALQEYLDENLAKNFIRYIKSSASASIFFVKEKDGSP
jgi:hypothetical protein